MIDRVNIYFYKSLTLAFIMLKLYQERELILYLEIEVTAKPKARKEKQAFERPYFSHFWDYDVIKYCWLCGQTETRTGSICQYCQTKLPIKKS